VEQQPLFFEDIYDAFRYLVQVCGGAKKVGAILFPEKGPEAAGRYLMDCLNSGRSEKLDFEHMTMLLRIGREGGCHGAIEFVCSGAGYSKPTPIDPADEKAELQRQLNRNLVELRQLVNRLGLDPNGKVS